MKYLIAAIALFVCFTSCDKKMAANEGVTDSGYTYTHHRQNDGPKPQEGDQVRYHEIIFLNDSLVKSSHYGFEPINAIIPPRDEVATPPPASFEAILMMAPGDSLTIIQDLAKFKVESLPKWLKEGDVLRYELLMLSLRPKSEVEKEINAVKAREKTVGDSLRMRLEMYKKGELNDEITTADNGLKYIIHEMGVGDTIAKGKFLQVHYYGALMEDGAEFDNTFKKARPFPFQVGRGRVIQGWDEGMLNVKKGGKITLFIPYQLAYGEAGKPARDTSRQGIPERSDIAFYVEVLDVR